MHIIGWNILPLAVDRLLACRAITGMYHHGFLWLLFFSCTGSQHSCKKYYAENAHFRISLDSSVTIINDPSHIVLPLRLSPAFYKR